MVRQDLEKLDLIGENTNLGRIRSELPLDAFTRFQSKRGKTAAIQRDFSRLQVARDRVQSVLARFEDIVKRVIEAVKAVKKGI